MAKYDGGTYVGILGEAVAADNSIISAAADESLVVYSMSLMASAIGNYTVTFGASAGAQYIFTWSNDTDSLLQPVWVDLSQAFVRGDWGDDVVIREAGGTSSLVSGTIVYARKKQAT